MSYASQDTDGLDPTFQSTVRQAVVAQAQLVMLEASTVANHALRSAYACAVIRNPTSIVPGWSWAVLSDGTTTTGSSDAAILARVASLWDCFAGMD